MKLYLSSYKIGDKTEHLKKWIEENHNKIFLIPNALDQFPDGERKSESINSNISELRALGFEVEILNLKDFFEKPEKIVGFINNVKAFYVIGGNTFVLRLAMKFSGFDEFIKSKSNDPSYLYAGFSAGICVLAESLIGTELTDDPNINPYNNQAAIYEGLGLIDYMPIPHYKSDHKESKLAEITKEFYDKHNIKYKTLSDGDVIIDSLSLDPFSKLQNQK